MFMGTDGYIPFPVRECICDCPAVKLGVSAVSGTLSLFRYKIIADLSGVKVAGYSTLRSRRGAPSCFILILIEGNH